MQIYCVLYSITVFENNDIFCWSDLLRWTTNILATISCFKRNGCSLKDSDVSGIELAFNHDTTKTLKTFFINFRRQYFSTSLSRKLVVVRNKVRLLSSSEHLLPFVRTGALLWGVLFSSWDGFLDALDKLQWWAVHTINSHPRDPGTQETLHMLRDVP